MPSIFLRSNGIPGYAPDTLRGATRVRPQTRQRQPPCCWRAHAPRFVCWV